MSSDRSSEKFIPANAIPKISNLIRSFIDNGIKKIFAKKSWKVSGEKFFFSQIRNQKYSPPSPIELIVFFDFTRLLISL